MGSLRKYLLNGALISSILSGVGAYRQGRKNPTDWRTYLTWVAWLLTLIVAVGTIRKESKDPTATSSRGPKLKDPRKK